VKPLVNTGVLAYSEVMAMADDLLAQPPEFFEPFLGKNPSWEQVKDLVDQQVKGRLEEVIWLNELYQVAVRPADLIDANGGWPALIHLSIKRRDRRPIHDWRDLQEIKNQIVGPEHEAIELYPAESRRVDSANQYHLFVLKDAKIRFPFGFQSRYVTDVPFSKSVNRPL
jgi:hypothetical protein